MRIWDLNSGKCLKILHGHANDISYVKIISNERIISGSYKEIKIWDIDSGVCLRTLLGNSNYIKGIVQLST